MSVVVCKHGAQKLFVTGLPVLGEVRNVVHGVCYRSDLRRDHRRRPGLFAGPPEGTEVKRRALENLQTGGESLRGRKDHVTTLSPPQGAGGEALAG